MSIFSVCHDLARIASKGKKRIFKKSRWGLLDCLVKIEKARVSQYLWCLAGQGEALNQPIPICQQKTKSIIRI